MLPSEGQGVPVRAGCTPLPFVVCAEPTTSPDAQKILSKCLWTFTGKVEVTCWSGVKAALFLGESSILQALPWPGSLIRWGLDSARPLSVLSDGTHLKVSCLGPQA